MTEDGHIVRVQLTPDGTAAANYAFDVTPANLVTGLITERGIAEPSVASLAKMFPEQGRPTDRDPWNSNTIPRAKEVTIKIQYSGNHFVFR